MLSARSPVGAWPGGIPFSPTGALVPSGSNACQPPSGGIRGCCWPFVVSGELE
jgi:hypothetical protein